MGQIAGLKENARWIRTSANIPIVVEIHRMLQRFRDRLAEEIHKEALKLPLYRMVFEGLGLKGPALAYIVSHDRHNLAMMSRDSLTVRYRMVPLHRKRFLRSHILITIASACVLNENTRYKAIYDHYRNKGKQHWSAALRVANILLRDLHRIARKAGPPA